MANWTGMLERVRTVRGNDVARALGRARKAMVRSPVADASAGRLRDAAEWTHAHVPRVAAAASHAAARARAAVDDAMPEARRAVDRSMQASVAAASLAGARLQGAFASPRGRRAWQAALAGAAALGAMALYVRRETARVDRALPARGSFVDADGVRLHCVERGEGPVVVLLHGNGSRIEEVEASGIVERLARNHRVIAFDRPGFGHSTRPAGQAWNVEAQARLFLRGLDALGVERATIVGHSWSSLVALAMALEAPQRIVGLVLMSGYYYPTLRPDFLLASAAAWPVAGTLLRNTTTPVASRALWPRTLRALFRPNDPPETMRRLDPWAFLRPHSLRAQGEEALWLLSETARLEGRYAEVRAPTVLMAGEQDPFLDHRQQAQRLYRTIDDASLRWVQDAGHMLHHVDPEAVVRAVADVERGGRGRGVSRVLIPDATAMLPESDASPGHAD